MSHLQTIFIGGIFTLPSAPNFVRALSRQLFSLSVAWSQLAYYDKLSRWCMQTRPTLAAWSISMNHSSLGNKAINRSRSILVNHRISSLSYLSINHRPHICPPSLTIVMNSTHGPFSIVSIQSSQIRSMARYSLALMFFQWWIYSQQIFVCTLALLLLMLLLLSSPLHLLSYVLVEVVAPSPLRRISSLRAHIVLSKITQLRNVGRSLASRHEVKLCFLVACLLWLLHLHSLLPWSTWPWLVKSMWNGRPLVLLHFMLPPMAPLPALPPLPCMAPTSSTHALLTSHNSWLINSRASAHMTGSPSLLHSLTLTSSIPSISIADDHSCPIKRVWHDHSHHQSPTLGCDLCSQLS